MKRLVIANWKSHKTSKSGQQWFDRFKERYHHKSGVEVIVAPSMVSLEAMSGYVHRLGLNVSLAAQDVSPFPLGSYTGAVAADLLKPIAHYAIIGHSERKRYFHETTQDVVNKVNEVVDCGLTPLVCVEKVEDLKQLLALVEVDKSDVVVAYTPVDALNFAIAESVEKVANAVAEIKRILPSCAVVYGGAVHRDNAKAFFEIDNLSGLFVGAASLEVESFLKICSYAAS